MNQRGEIILVSVIMPVFNEQLCCLQESINGVLGQSYKNIELIIIDDSTDEKTVNYLTNIAESDDRVVYIHNREKLGFVRSLNKGLSLARGKFIARADSDDISKKGRIIKQRLFLEEHKDIGIVGCSLEKIDNEGRMLGIRLYPSCPDRVEKAMMIRNAVAHPTVMFRREVIDKIGFYNELLIKGEDYELWMRAIKKGIKIANIEEPLVCYRVSNTSKRDITNWKNNLKVKLHCFGHDHLGYRVIGIAAVSTMLVMPSFLKKFVYSIYNKIA